MVSAQAMRHHRQPAAARRAHLPKDKPTTMPTQEAKRAELRRAALEYHEFPVPGKIAIAATKQLLNQHDLSLA